ncbi:MAG TPA: redoxin domain-containing protein [Flavobacteriales bacterium]|nr:redoxin domain-containing protein [Flavobacteriales bacterium]
MKKLLFLLALITTSGFSLKAQNPLLKFRINGIKDTTVHLAYYFGNKLYYSDTSRADKTGTVIFGKKKTYEPGVYAVVIPGTRYFEIVLNNEPVEMNTDTSDLNGKMVVVKSKENKLFYDYIQFINARRLESEPHREKMKTADSKSKEFEDAKAKLAQVDKKVKDHQAAMFKDNPTSLTAKIIRLSTDPEIPEPPKNADGSLKDSLFAYKYAKAHYWDHLDFSDPRLVRCPFYHNRLESYFKNMIAQVPDTMIVEADRLISKMLDNKDMFKYTVHYLTYTFESSKQMCMDAAFVHLAFKYYKTGKAFWLEEDKVKKVIDRAEELAPILCNVAVHPLSMPDTTMKWRRLYDVKAQFTILIFWDPECGHCKKEMPKFAEMYAKLKAQGVEIWAVSSDRNDKWFKFIRDNKMNFINVAIPEEVYSNQELAKEWLGKGYTDLKSLNYRTAFDIYSTPKVFLLDKDKKILAKQIDADQIEKLIEFYRNKEKK